ncbi:BatD family protein [Lysobacter sp. CW239]|uniref:BatD family protein n=2 Tax=Lysobacteraceae TaxID=32033 RepID=UPI001746A5D8|nr:BatD family protein [Lysobacter sp. CW239]QOD90656.1 BatD family protein [Lysobacter sp. CW239]
MSRVSLQIVVLLLLSFSCLAATAQTRAWLDRDRIAFGETVTLNIETDANAAPDYGPLQAGFDISGRSSRRQVELGSSGVRTRTLYAVALRPRRDGVITIPGLSVGNQRTDPLVLVVAPASTVPPAGAGDDVFLESEPDDASPYVQQAVGWVVRLYSAVPLVSGQLDQPAPDGASLRQVGDDAQYSRQIDGRRYQVIERRYLLIPERSGDLVVPGATFQGRGASGFFDEFLGGGGALQAQAPPRKVAVQPVPAQAPQPWLPLHGLTLNYRATPQQLRVGEAATLTVEAVVDGASAAQMPELQLPPVDGVQVFAEPVQADERFVDGRPQVTLTRQFALVPSRAGPLRMPGLQLDWWDVGGDQARIARLPPLEWTVAAGTGGRAGRPPSASAAPAAANPPASSSGPPTASSLPTGADRRWVLATAAFGLLWLLTLLWGLHRQPAHVAANPSAAMTHAPAAKPGIAAFKRALDSGDFDEVADRLCALAQPPVQGLDEVRARLADPAQADAVEAMQRARWGGGDGVVARRLMRDAFARGPRWRPSSAAPPSPLPPLYPDT